VRDVVKFIGFAQFYSRFIHHFEIRIVPLRELTKLEYTEPVAPHWTPAAQAALEDMKEAILSDPCLLRFDYRKLIVLRTDFSKDGFGFVLCQPASDDATLNAVQEYRDGKGFSNMTKSSSAVLHPVCFGARRSLGNEVRLHSHLGEGFAGDYAINKCSHMLFGQRFVWVTDCYAIKFILSYEGGNSAILRLQMRLMCWDVDIVHRPDTELVDAGPGLRPTAARLFGICACTSPFEPTSHRPSNAPRKYAVLPRSTNSGTIKIGCSSRRASHTEPAH
jgi:hypothetical protein